MEACYQPLLQMTPPDRDTRPDPARLPRIELNPPPEAWPNPEDYLPEED